MFILRYLFQVVWLYVLYVMEIMKHSNPPLSCLSCTCSLLSAISWCVEPETHEVIVQGLKQGVNTRKEIDRNCRCGKMLIIVKVLFIFSQLNC